MDTIDYVYIICIIVDVIHSNRNHKLRMNSSSNYKFLNQNKIIRLIVRYTMQENIFKILSCMILYQQSDNIFIQIDYICIFWIIINTSNIIWDCKLYTNGNSGNKLNRNGIVYQILFETITIMFMIKNFDEFDANVNKVDHIAYEINKFVLIITIINVSDIIQCQINKLIDIYAITCGEYLFIRIDYIIAQTAIYVFMLPFKFICSHGKDLVIFHSIALKMDDFDLIIAFINSTNIIIVQVDHSYVVLMTIMDEFLMTVMDNFKWVCMSFYNNVLIISVENWFIFIVSKKAPMVNTILLTMIILMCPFYVILCVLVCLNIRINNGPTFNLHPITVQTTSNQGQMTVQRGSNVHPTTVKHSTKHPTQPKRIFTIAVWIHICNVYQQILLILNRMRCICTIKIKINAIYSIYSHQSHTNSSNGFKWDQNGIILCILNENIPIMFTIIHCNKFIANICNMNQFDAIDDAIHTLNLIMTMLDVVDINIGDTLLFIVTHGAGSIDMYIKRTNNYIMFMIKHYDEFDATVNKIDHTGDIMHEINNFDLIITIINVLDIILHQTKKLIAMTRKSCILDVIQSMIAQTILHVFMLLFEFNTDSDDNDLLSLYLIVIKMDDFASIMTIITAINAPSIIIIQNDHNYVFLMITYVVMGISKLFFYHFMTIRQLVSMTIAFCILKKKYEVDQFYSIVNKIHDFDIFMTMIKIQMNTMIEILIAIFVIVDEISLFIVTHGIFVLTYKVNTQSNAADLFLFYLILNKIDKLNVITCIFNTIITLIVQINRIDIVLIMVPM